ncbi:MAG: hypothetical protein ACKOXK_10410 [Chakrabartia sp.]
MNITVKVRPRGRPQKINPEDVWSKVLGYIASGDALSTALQRLDPAPSYTWAKVQLRENSNLQAAYRAAIEDRADALADDIIALADSEPPAHLEGAALSAWVQQLKLRVHAREWTASKLRPRVYGDKIDVSVQHSQISVLAALERAERRLVNARPDLK